MVQKALADLIAEVNPALIVPNKRLCNGFMKVTLVIHCYYNITNIGQILQLTLRVSLS